MSSIWKKPEVTLRQTELTWMNNIYNSHDLWCHCEDPQLHLMIIINKTSSAPKPESEITNIKCLLTGDHTTAATEDDGGFAPGDLEKLFEEDIEDTKG